MRTLDASQLLWMAPELLRLIPGGPILGTQKGDIYSLAIIIQELITETSPYDCCLDSQEPQAAESKHQLRDVNVCIFNLFFIEQKL